ncbi:MAG: OsmC family protein [Brumimicrobium sp.]|nr:OsmC family protein [Brumimicrobium sp.]
MIRTATANWKGNGKEGKGHLTTQSTVLEKTQYSFNTRFEDGKGTNPEELIGAAHAGCFSMKLAFNLAGAGFQPKELETKCEVKFENGEICESRLILKAQVEAIPEEKFAELVQDAKENCPISKLLNTKIALEYTLNK